MRPSSPPCKRGRLPGSCGWLSGWTSTSPRPRPRWSRRIRRSNGWPADRSRRRSSRPGPCAPSSGRRDVRSTRLRPTPSRPKSPPSVAPWRTSARPRRSCSSTCPPPAWRRWPNGRRSSASALSRSGERSCPPPARRSVRTGRPAAATRATACAWRWSSTTTPRTPATWRGRSPPAEAPPAGSQPTSIRRGWPARSPAAARPGAAWPRVRTSSARAPAATRPGSRPIAQSSLRRTGPCHPTAVTRTSSTPASARTPPREQRRRAATSTPSAGRTEGWSWPRAGTSEPSATGTSCRRRPATTSLPWAASMTAIQAAPVTTCCGSARTAPATATPMGPPGTRTVTSTSRTCRPPP